MHLDYTKVIILILWWRNFQLEYWRTFQLVSTAHNFIVVVEDNFSNSYELEFDFNNRNVKDDDLTIVPIGNFSPLLK